MAEPVHTEKGFDQSSTPARDDDGAPDVSERAVEQAAEAQAEAARQAKDDKSKDELEKNQVGRP